jgi:5-methylcytosine-specific restriction endonuclease McrA
VSLNGKRTGNPTARSNRSSRRRGRVLAGASVRGLTLDELYLRDRGVCYICKLPVPRHKATKEHVKALSKGGTDKPSNTRLACRKCNSKKGAKSKAQLEKAAARPGLKRKAFKRKPKTLEQRAARARQWTEYDETGEAPPLPFADELPPEDLF